eukprot:6290442-Amphidinium_carterae.1
MSWKCMQGSCSQCSHTSPSSSPAAHLCNCNARLCCLLLFEQGNGAVNTGGICQGATPSSCLLLGADRQTKGQRKNPRNNCQTHGVRPNGRQQATR